MCVCLFVCLFARLFVLFSGAACDLFQKKIVLMEGKRCACRGERVGLWEEGKDFLRVF